MLLQFCSFNDLSSKYDNLEAENRLLKERKKTEVEGLASQLDQLRAYELSYKELIQAHEELVRKYVLL